MTRPVPKQGCQHNRTVHTRKLLAVTSRSGSQFA
jgi:hypothetical protein